MAITRRQFLWNLSQAVVILSCAGGFWILLGLPQRPIWTFAVVGGAVAALLWGATRLRAMAEGFSVRELRTLPEQERLESKRWMRIFVATNIAQWMVDVLAVVYCVRRDREDLIWPIIGLVLGIHFLPIGYASRLRAYYVMGVLMVVFSALSLGMAGDARMLLVGCGVGGTMWATVLYLLGNRESVVRHACEFSIPNS